ncbi:hypothetical protein PoB_007111200, partial [Plakobranchus ocellatus]
HQANVDDGKENAKNKQPHRLIRSIADVVEAPSVERSRLSSRDNWEMTRNAVFDILEGKASRA